MVGNHVLKEANCWNTLCKTRICYFLYELEQSCVVQRTACKTKWRTFGLIPDVWFPRLMHTDTIEELDQSLRTMSRGAFTLSIPRTTSNVAGKTLVVIHQRRNSIHQMPLTPVPMFGDRLQPISRFEPTSFNFHLHNTLRMTQIVAHYADHRMECCGRRLTYNQSIQRVILSKNP